MTEFQGPTNLTHNRGLIADPAAFAKDADAESWLFLCGEEFAEMDGGMSYADVQSAVHESMNLIADPPQPFDMDVAQRGVAALDEWPDPRSTRAERGHGHQALVYLYAGLRPGAPADEVLACGEADGAPFSQAEPLTSWVVQALAQLS